MQECVAIINSWHLMGWHIRKYIISGQMLLKESKIMLESINLIQMSKPDGDRDCPT